jgi:hypothetical protein
MTTLKTLLFVTLTLLVSFVKAQAKPSVSLDAKTSGVILIENDFDLGENGFIVVLISLKMT